jgi:hypothetical protein
MYPRPLQFLRLSIPVSLAVYFLTACSVPEKNSGIHYARECKLRLKVMDAEFGVIRERLGGLPAELAGHIDYDKERWNCSFSRKPFRIINSGSDKRLILVDATPHMNGYLVLYGLGKVALVPTRNFEVFCHEASNGVLHILPQWETAGERIK